MSVAKHVRIFDPDPSDDFVTKREGAIKDLRSRFSKLQNAKDIIMLGSSLATGCLAEVELPESLTSQIEAAIKKQSASFVREGRALEMQVCGLLAAIELVQSWGATADRWSVADVLAVGLWSALDFLPPSSDHRLESLRIEAVEASRNRILKTALSSRERKTVPDLGVFGDETTAKAAFAQATGATIAALRANAALDREELDLLWWILVDRSDILDKPLASLSIVSRAIITGLELGALMRRLPSQAHRNLALRNVETVESMSLPELLDAIADDRAPICASLEDESLIANAPGVFPLLAALHSGRADGDAAAQRRSLADWTGRSLLERAVIRVQYSINNFK